MSLVLSLLGGLGIHQVLLITSKIAHKRELAIANSRQRQAELEARNADLEQLNRFFFHELKGPLITIQSFAGSLQLDLEKDRRDRAAKDFRRILGTGTGLGLTLARRAANNLGGSLKFLPVAQGCCLRLELPRRE